MTLARNALVVLAAVVAILYSLYSSPQHPPGSSLSPKFDGRDSGSPGEYFRNSQSLWLYYQWYLPESDTAPTAVVVHLHGYGEHGGRYAKLGADFTREGFAFVTLDHQGSGRSEGDRAHVEKFSHLADDAALFINTIVKTKFPKQRIFLMGHSMGGLIALHTLAEHPKLAEGLILSSPAVQVASDVANPTLIKIGRLLSKYLPRLPVPGQKLPTEGRISHRREVVEDYKNDPLNYHGDLKARFSIEILDALTSIESKLPSIKHPLFCFHSRADSLTPVGGAEKVERLVASKDKTFKYYEAPYLHELLHEPEVRAEVVNWVKKQSKK